jgi:hypothetical protein
VSVYTSEHYRYLKKIVEDDNNTLFHVSNYITSLTQFFAEDINVRFHNKAPSTVIPKNSVQKVLLIDLLLYFIIILFGIFVSIADFKI